MFYGIVYAYYLDGRSEPLYVGQARGNSYCHAIQRRHCQHLNGPLPFDRFMRRVGVRRFWCKPIWYFKSSDSRHLRAVLMIEESKRIKKLRPRLNIKGLRSRNVIQRIRKEKRRLIREQGIPWRDLDWK
jgi:hypothetical protein